MSYQETKSEAETSEAKKPSPRKLPIFVLDQEWNERSDIDVAVVVCDGKIAYLLRRGLASEILKEKECSTNDQIEHALKQIVKASDRSFTRTMQALRFVRNPTAREWGNFALLAEQDKKNAIYPKFCDRKHENEFMSVVSNLTSEELIQKLKKDEQFSVAFQIELIAGLLFDQHVTISVGKLMNLATDGATIYLFGQAAETPKAKRKTKIIGKVYAANSGVKDALNYIREGKNDVTHQLFEFLDDEPNRQRYLQNYLHVLNHVDFQSCFPHLGFTDLQAKIDEYLVPGIQAHQHQQIVSCFYAWQICNEQVVERYDSLPSDARSQLEMIQKKYPTLILVYEVSKRAASDALEPYDKKLEKKFAALVVQNEELEANNEARHREQEANRRAEHKEIMEQLRKLPPSYAMTMVDQGASARARSVSPSQVTDHLEQVEDLSDSEVDGSLSTL